VRGPELSASRRRRGVVGRLARRPQLALRVRGQCPLCMVVIVLASRYVPESRNPSASNTIDVPGVLFGALGLAGLTYTLTAWPGQGFSWPHGRHRRGRRSGPSRVCRHRTAFPSPDVTDFPVRLTQLQRHQRRDICDPCRALRSAALPGALPSGRLGWTALRAGAATLPLSLLLLASRFGTLASRIGARPLMIGGPHTAATGLVLLAVTQVTRHTPWMSCPASPFWGSDSP
jgi:hypothetical protein